MASSDTTKDNGHMTTETTFTKLDGLIEAAWKNYPGGDFFLEIPAAEWDEVEASLNRSKFMKKFSNRFFMWKGEGITRGSKWMVHGVEQ